MEASTVINVIMFAIVPLGAVATWLHYRRQRRLSEKKTHRPRSKLSANNSAEISNSHQQGISSQGS